MDSQAAIELQALKSCFSSVLDDLAHIRHVITEAEVRLVQLLNRIDLVSSQMGEQSETPKAPATPTTPRAPWNVIQQLSEATSCGEISQNLSDGDTNVDRA
ncbi:hypothetical protein QQS21_002096 [Conoideocrella luteorostrata]|uniref:Uncharacterized protein n=1 Tax=Conoideocrella luteorostrata TaxID=1105319 RepID=A0AAJ0CVS1_9HYPO|nr:hypothetical protein QQS21_002096 [Conoideocrella luteorostrata]